MKRILAFAIVTFAFIIGLNAQPASLYYMTNIRQSLYTNPARLCDCGFSFSLPATPLFFQLNSDPLKYSLIFSQDEQTGKFYLDLDKVLANMSDNNYIYLDNRISLLNFGIRYKYFFFNFDYSYQMPFIFNYSKGLIDFLANGNANGTIDLSGFGINTMIYNQKAFTFGYQPLKNLTVGASIKLVNGLLDITTNNISAVATVDTATNNNYPVTISADYSLQTAGLSYPYFDQNGNFTFGLAGVDANNKLSVDSVLAILRKNSGVAFDLGVVYSPIKYVELSASVIDLGSIKWRKNATTIQAKAENVVFDGIDLFDSTKTQQLLDTLKQQLQPSLTYSPYKTSLYTKVYLGIALQPVDYLKLGFNYRGLKLPNSWFNTYTLGAYFNPGYSWNLSLTYTIVPGQSNNFGMGAGLKLGFAQIFFLADNLSIPNFGISYFTNRDVPYNLNSATNWLKNTQLVNFMFGINFNFGCRDRIDYGLLD